MPILTLSFPSRSFVESKSCRYPATWALNQLYRTLAFCQDWEFQFSRYDWPRKQRHEGMQKKRRSHRLTSAASKGWRLLRQDLLAWGALNIAGGKHMSAVIWKSLIIWYKFCSWGKVYELLKIYFTYFIFWSYVSFQEELNQTLARPLIRNLSTKWRGLATYADAISSDSKSPSPRVKLYKWWENC